MSVCLCVSVYVCLCICIPASLCFICCGQVQDLSSQLKGTSSRTVSSLSSRSRYFKATSLLTLICPLSTRCSVACLPHTHTHTHTHIHTHTHTHILHPHLPPSFNLSFSASLCGRGDGGATDRGRIALQKLEEKKRATKDEVLHVLCAVSPFPCLSMCTVYAGTVVAFASHDLVCFPLPSPQLQDKLAAAEQKLKDSKEKVCVALLHPAAAPTATHPCINKPLVSSDARTHTHTHACTHAHTHTHTHLDSSVLGLQLHLRALYTGKRDGEPTHNTGRRGGGEGRGGCDYFLRPAQTDFIFLSHLRCLCFFIFRLRFLSVELMSAAA